MLWGTLGATLLRNMLPVKGVLWAVKGTIRAGEPLLEQSRMFNAASSYK